MPDAQERAIKASANDNAEPFKRKPTTYVDPGSILAFQIENAIITKFNPPRNYIRLDMVAYDDHQRDDILVNYWTEGEFGAEITSFRYHKSTGKAERT